MEKEMSEFVFKTGDVVEWKSATTGETERGVLKEKCNVVEGCWIVKLLDKEDFTHVGRSRLTKVNYVLRDEDGKLAGSSLAEFKGLVRAAAIRLARQVCEDEWTDKINDELLVLGIEPIKPKRISATFVFEASDDGEVDLNDPANAAVYLLYGCSESELEDCLTEAEVIE